MIARIHRMMSSAGTARRSYAFRGAFSGWLFCKPCGTDRATTKYDATHHNAVDDSGIDGVYGNRVCQQHCSAFLLLVPRPVWADTVHVKTSLSTATCVAKILIFAEQFETPCVLSGRPKTWNCSHPWKNKAGWRLRGVVCRMQRSAHTDGMILMAI